MKTISNVNEEVMYGKRNISISNRIIKNINWGKRMQMIYCHTPLDIIGRAGEEGLTRHFLNHGLNVLCYLQQNECNTAYGIRLENGGSVYCCSEEYIEGMPCDYDIIIVDAPVNRFEAQFIDNETEYLRFPNLHNYINKVKQNSNVYIICFEATPEISKSMYSVPVIATTEMITERNKHLIYPEYTESLKVAYDKLKKYELALDNNVLKHRVRESEYSNSYLFESFFTGDQQSKAEKENVQALMQLIMDRLQCVEEKVEKLSDEVGVIEKRVNQISTDLGRYWEIVCLYSSVSELKGGESDLFIKKLIDKAISEQTVNLEYICSLQHYKAVEDEIANRMQDDVWNKMSSESKRLLVTARLYFDELEKYGDNIDYSSVCMLTSKVFEIEIARRFVDGYKAYLKRKGLMKRDIPSALLMKKNGRTVILGAEDFTLGNCPYLMGVVGKNSMDKQINQMHFIEYCKEQLLPDMSEQQIIKWIRKYDSQIRHVKERFRNPAAHKGISTKIIAYESFGYLYDSGISVHTPLLIALLRDFNN